IVPVRDPFFHPPSADYIVMTRSSERRPGPGRTSREHERCAGQPITMTVSTERREATSPHAISMTLIGAGLYAATAAIPSEIVTASSVSQLLPERSYLMRTEPTVAVSTRPSR